MGDYARALAAGSELSASDRAAIAEKLHEYTGLPVDYILKADLRIDGGEFRQNLQGDGGLTTGRLDSRFSGPDIDPLSQRADYDPQSTALELSLCLGVQRLRAQGAALRRRESLQAEHPDLPHLELRAPAAGAAGRPAPLAAPGHQRACRTSPTR